MATVEIERPSITKQDVEQPVELDETGRVLMRATEILRERGWCGNDLRGPNGQVCVGGAIMLALGGGEEGWPMGPVPPKAFTRLMKSLGGVGFANGFLAAWNDRVCHTEVQAIEALERAAYRIP